jgi:hypothetical protein
MATSKELRDPELDAYFADPVALIKDKFVLENGRPYGEVIQDWQDAFFRAIFALKAPGVPRHRLVYREARRGEAKTEDCAAAALADLLTGPDRHRSFAVAKATFQAELLLDSIAGFQSRSPILHEIEIQKMLVTNTATGAQLRVLSSDDKVSFGIRPRKVFFDELSLQDDDRQWLSLWTAIGKRADAQMIAVSMAGWDFTSLAWRTRELARTQAPKYFFSTREGTEPAPWLSAEQMEEQRLTLHPADFARFWECRWVEPKGAWVTKEMYDAAELGREAASATDEAKRVGFVDVGLVRDATAIAIEHLDGERTVLDTLRTLQGTRDEPVQLDVLEDLVADLTRRFNVKQWVFESPQAVASVQRLQNRLPVEVIARYPTAETQAKLWGHLYQLFSNKRLVLYTHERLRTEALSLVTRVVGGRLKTLESSSVHQDHILAVGGAALLLDEYREEGLFVIHQGMSWRQGSEEKYESPRRFQQKPPEPFAITSNDPANWLTDDESPWFR